MVALTAVIRPVVKLVVRPVFFTVCPTMASTSVRRRQPRTGPLQKISRSMSWKSASAIAQSTMLFCWESGTAGVSCRVMNRDRRAMRSAGSVPPSIGPGCRIGAPTGPAFTSASTWLLLRM
jgi:hypothetical protein